MIILTSLLLSCFPCLSQTLAVTCSAKSDNSWIAQIPDFLFQFLFYHFGTFSPIILLWILDVEQDRKKTCLFQLKRFKAKTLYKNRCYCLYTTHKNVHNVFYAVKFAVLAKPCTCPIGSTELFAVIPTVFPIIPLQRENL